MIPKALQDITEDDLDALLTAGRVEDHRIEYKRSSADDDEDGGSGKRTIKILRSVTAFANADGGDLIYGIATDKGIPVGKVGMDPKEVDSFMGQVSSVCLQACDPPLRPPQFKAVPLKGGGSAVVLRIERSFAGPHRVVANKHAHFYLRHSNGIAPMDVQNLRRAFLSRQNFMDRASGLRDQRLAQMKTGRLPVPMTYGERARIALLIVPLNYDEGSTAIDVDALRQDGGRLPPVFGYANARGHGAVLVFDGLASYFHKKEAASEGYGLLHRDGRLEMVAEAERIDKQSGRTVVHELTITDYVEGSLARGLAYLGNRGVTGPALAFVFVSNAVGRGLALADSGWQHEDHICAADDLVPPPAFVQAIPTDPVECKALAASSMDLPIRMLCNGFGYTRPTKG